jgi:hypothetical protein
LPDPSADVADQADTIAAIATAVAPGQEQMVYLLQIMQVVVVTEVPEFRLI